MILKKVSMNNIDLKDSRMPTNIEYYTHDAFDIDVLSSNINQYLKTEYTVSIAGQIKKVIGKTGIINDVMKKMVKIIPLDFHGVGAMIDDHEELVDKLYKRLNSLEYRESCTVFIHRDFYKVAKKLNIDNRAKYLNKLIEQSFKDSMNHDWTRHNIASKVEDILLEVSTLTDTRCQVYMGSGRLSSLITLVFLDYLTTSEFPIDDFTFHRELIFALSRDMFYKTKIENVLGILKKNRADLGPLMWMLMEILEKDKLNSNPLYMMEKIAHLGSDVGLDVTDAMRKLLFNNYMKPEAFDTKAYSENFEALGTTNQNIISQVTGLYLSNNPKTIASYSVPEELSGSTIDNVDIKWSKDSLRTMNYKKIAKNIDKLEESRFDIKTQEERASLLETAKNIISDIYDIQNSDETKYPEMEVLLDKVQEIITEIQNQPLGEEAEDLSTQGEGVISAAAKVGRGIVRLPSNIVRAFKMLGRPLDIFRWSNEYDDERKNSGEYKNKGPMLATRFFLKIEEIIDKAIPNSVKLGPIGINTDKMNNQRMLKKVRRQSKNRFMAEKIKDKWDATAKESLNTAEKYIDTYLDYTDYYVGKEDAMDVMKSIGNGTAKATRASVKAGKNAWRWYTIKKAFKEAMTAINYIAEHNSVNEYEIKRIAMDHIKYWEGVASAMEENLETEKMALSIRKELIKFKKKLVKKNINTESNKVSSEESYSDYLHSTTPGFESFVDSYKEDDKKKYVDEMGRPFRDNVENHMEEEESEEKEEALEDLEDTILDKLKDKGAISEEDENDINSSAESVIDFFRDNGFNKMDPKSLQTKLTELEEKIKSTDNIKKKYKLQDIRSSMLEFIERSKSIPMKDIVKFQKPGKAYLVFHEGATDIGKVISIFTHSPFSHCDVVIDNEVYTVVESSGKYEINPDKNVVVYELSPKVSVKKLKEFYNEEKDKGYNYGGVLKSQILGFSTKNKERFKAYFCSQYVIAGIDYASDKQFTFKGKPLLAYGYDYFSPKRLFNFMQQSEGFVKNKTTLR